MKIKNKPAKGVLIKERRMINVEDFNHPIFCFKYLHSDFHLNNCTSDEKVALVEQMVKLSTLTWINIQAAPKHGIGSEKISIASIRPSLPSIITEDISFLLALRFLGRAPFIGLRNKFIFHVIYIDRVFNAYKH